MVTIADVVATEGLDISLIAARGETGRGLTGASVNEHEDPTPWLEGGELVMTDGMGLDPGRAAAMTYVGRLHAAGIAALALGVGPGLRYLEVPAELSNACEHYSLPLLRVPSTTPFIKITDAVYGRLLEQRSADASRLVEAQRALTSAAAKPGSAPAVVSALARLTGLWARLCDVRGATVSAAPAGAPELPATATAALDRIRGRKLRGSASFPVGEGHARAQAVGTEQLRGFLVYGTEEGLIGEFAGAVASFAVSLLSIDWERRHVVRRLALAPRGDTLARLAAGMPGAAAARMLASVGIQAERVRISVVGSLPGEPPPFDELADALSDSLIRMDDGEVTLLAAENAPRFAERVADVAGAHPVGIGGPVRPSACPVSLRQARHALAIARRTGQVVDAMTLGSARLLLQLGAPEALTAYADAVLRPLEAADADGPAALITALRAWLDSGAVIETAAAALGVHRHTMRQRLRRIEEATGRSLDSPRDHAELWLAFEARDIAASWLHE
ncbi:MAG TPA: PucR family transcriptional regulator ligand-binding domain-containing protein [Streptosporangiaceae bacterium]